MKNAMKLPALLLLSAALTLHACSSRGKTSGAVGTDKDAKPPVELLKATSRNWTAGIMGGGSGTEYTFTVAVHATGDMRFTRIALGGADHVPTTVRPGSTVTNAPVVPHQGDTLHLRLSLPSGSGPGTAQTLIHYTLNTTEQQLPVPTIERLPAEKHP